MSSDGCSTRHSTYSAKSSPASIAFGGDLHRFTGLGSQVVVPSFADGLEMLVWHSQQHSDHPHGHPSAQISHEVEPLAADEGIQTFSTEFADLGFESADLARGEHPGQQLAMDVVDRRILENDEARRDVDVGLHGFQHVTPGRAERFDVDRCTVDVRESAQCVEVVLAVVVQRRFLPKPRIRRVRTDIQLDVVGVITNIAHSSNCHGFRLSERFRARSGKICCRR